MISIEEIFEFNTTGLRLYINNSRQIIEIIPIIIVNSSVNMAVIDDTGDDITTTAVSYLILSIKYVNMSTYLKIRILV